MNEVWKMVLSFLAGIALGTIFFGGLWLTIRIGISSKWSAFWFPGSLLLRMSIVLAGFYIVSAGHWERLLVCFLAFVIVRIIFPRFTPDAEKTTHLPLEF
jgi:F1F0 ATPase subunit 2